MEASAEADRDLREHGIENAPGARIPIIETAPETKWSWSDLHLADRDAAYLEPPIPDHPGDDRHLPRSWSRRVRADDAIIFLGDVDHPDAWRDRRLILDFGQLPGQAPAGAREPRPRPPGAADAGFDTMCTAALCLTNPPLPLSHVARRKVPTRAVNIRRYLHGAEAPTSPHINVSVERTDYVRSA